MEYIWLFLGLSLFIGLGTIVQLLFHYKRKKIEGYVYCIIDPNGKELELKIGQTKASRILIRPIGRTSNPHIKFFGYIPTNSRGNLERKIHKDLREYRLKGTEWFTFNKKDKKWRYWLKEFRKYPTKEHKNYFRSIKVYHEGSIS